MRSKGNKSPESPGEIMKPLALILLAVLPYANTLAGGFVYDDTFQVVGNPYVHSFRYLGKIFGTTVWSFQGTQGVTNYYRPLMSFTYLLLYKIGGSVPFTFHLANIVLHAVVVLLVFSILRRLSGERIALVAAGLFALHPIHTESVAWIASITDLELSAFYLLTFLLYLRLAEPDRGIGSRVAMCVSLAFALLSKEQAMTLPLLAVIFEHFYRSDRSETSPHQKFMRYAPLWGMVLLYIGVRTWVVGGFASVVSRPNLSWHDVFLSAIALIGAYLGKLVWPIHLSAFYVFYKSSHWTDSRVLLGILGIALCAVLFSILWKRQRVVSFGFVWLFLTLAPVLNARWMPAGVFAERYLYLPSVGFCWIAGWAAIGIWAADAPPLLRPLCKAVPYLLAVVALLFAVRTVTRNRSWFSGQTLFRQTLGSEPESSLMRTNLGAVYFNRGDQTRAEHEWLEALTAGPTNVFVLNDLGLLRARQHRYRESLDYFRRAIRARPVYAMAHLNLAETLAEMGRTQEADWQFRIATALSPLSTRALDSYGKFLVDSGRLQAARAEYERSVAVDPTAEAYDQLGDIYVAWQDSKRAERAFRRTLEMDPYDSEAHFQLGNILKSAGRPGEAMRQFELGIQTDPSNPEANAALKQLRANPTSPSQLPR
jgi:protein O-mannosyl-transferase